MFNKKIIFAFLVSILGLPSKLSLAALQITQSASQIAYLQHAHARQMSLTYKDIWAVHSNAYPQVTEAEMKAKSKLVQDGLIYRTLPQTSMRDRMATAFDMLGSTSDSSLKLSDQKEQKEQKYLASCWSAIKHNIIDDNAYLQDFYFFFGNKDQPHKHILNKLSRNRSKLGYARLAKRLTEITNDKSVLAKRQAIVRELVGNKEFFEQIDLPLRHFTPNEPVFQLFFNPEYQTQALLAVVDLYWKMLPKNWNESFNKSKNALEIGRRLNQMVTALRALNVIIDTNAIFKLKNSVLKDINAYIKACRKNSSSGAAKYISLLSTLNSLLTLMISTSQNSYSLVAEAIFNTAQAKLIDTLKQQVLSVKYTLNIAKDLCAKVSANKVLTENFEALQSMKKVFDAPSKAMQELLKIFESRDLGYGETLAAFTLAFEVQEELLALSRGIAECDMYNGIAAFYKEHQNTKNKVCFPTYRDQGMPYMDVNKLWNALLDPNTAIPNSIKLGKAVADSKGHNIILTGANEAGKSTFQRSMIIGGIILPQTLGIALCESLVLQPFDRVKYYQNTQDDPLGNRSLFGVQAYQFNRLFTIERDKICYISSDEPATGANARICAAIAFSAAGSVSPEKAPLCACVISTHYPLLAALENKTAGFFKNYKFDIQKKPDGTIFYPYEISEGVSDQHIELDIFKREGLKKEILDSAITMIKNDEDLKLMQVRSRL